eukprot:scaffold115457_cov66-Phaeocystis_antarctica.AAC.3
MLRRCQVQLLMPRGSTLRRPTRRRPRSGARAPSRLPRTAPVRSERSGLQGASWRTCGAQSERPGSSHPPLPRRTRE